MQTKTEKKGPKFLQKAVKEIQQMKTYNFGEIDDSQIPCLTRVPQIKRSIIDSAKRLLTALSKDTMEPSLPMARVDQARPLPCLGLIRLWNSSKMVWKMFLLKSKSCTESFQEP